MIKPILIKDKTIGKGHNTFLIAEMACAHQGDVENALKMVDLAVKSNADAIQLQIFISALEMCPTYKDYKLNCELEISHHEWKKVIEKIKKKNILFFSAAYDIESVEFLVRNDLDAFKIHSSDISNPEILIEIAKSGKPVFLSCGASKLEEIQNAIILLEENGTEQIVLMHGYQGFPTKVEDCNLEYIKTLQKLFGLNVGFYDHVDGGSPLAKIIPIMAIGYGARVIEKHFILTREDKGIDYESSLDTEQFAEFGLLLRECEKAIGNPHIRQFTEGELKYRAYCKKSIVAWKDIPKNTKITRELVQFVRNDPGIPPDEFDKIKGKIAKKDIKKYHNIKYEDF